MEKEKSGRNGIKCSRDIYALQKRKEDIKLKLYENLLVQAEKLYRHCRQGSYKTRARYFEAYKRFLAFLAREYRLQKLNNISAKHFSAYLEHMQKKGLAAATIKTDLTAIRFWHDQLSGSKYKLPSNDEFELERRQFGQIDKTWSQEEFQKFCLLCRNTGREEFLACAVLARYAGLRLHEVLRLDTATGRSACHKGVLTVKGKGGKVREIPINEPVRSILQAALECTKSGRKLFVPEYTPTHQLKAEIQTFIRQHRAEFSGRPLTFHGLRHTCAAEWYKKLTAEGLTETQVKLMISKWLGHEREEITKIYLAGVEKREGEENRDV